MVLLCFDFTKKECCWHLRISRPYWSTIHRNGRTNSHSKHNCHFISFVLNISVDFYLYFIVLYCRFNNKCFFFLRQQGALESCCILMWGKPPYPPTTHHPPSSLLRPWTRLLCYCTTHTSVQSIWTRQWWSSWHQG